MTDAFDDLLPLFLTEASERLGRVRSLIDARADDPENVANIRRELHALKGAGRMMGLVEFSQLCHRAESLLEGGGDGAWHEVTGICDELLSMASGAAPLEAVAGPTGGVNAADVPGLAADGGVWVPAGVMDRLADRSARLRVLSVAGSGAVERLFRLAGLAETGVNERAPRQILATLATSLRQLGIEVEAGQRRLQRLSEGLLETFLQQQVRPLQPVLYHLADHAGELAESLGKDVGVTVAGGETVLDRRIISALQESLLHVVRNAVDHGIEPPNDRREAGKPAAGQIVIEAKSELDRVRLTMRDDGRGIDPKEVVDAARSRGQLSDDEPTASTAEDILRLLCRPGVSTRREASEISGRGIGLDAVAATVQSVGGDLWLESTPGRGTTVTLELPVTRRGERVLVLGVGQLRVALPAAPVKSYRRLDLTRGPDGSVELPRDDDGRPMDLRFLADLVNRPRGGPGTVVIGSTAGAPLAVVADSVLGEEEVFVRPLPPEIGAPPVYDGVALTGSGRPVAVLSWQQMAHRPEHWTDRAVEDLTVATIRVLLVDDSRVTREMIRRLLEDAGFSVVAVGSAEEAIHELERGELDCLITDIEMPEIDGLELTRRLRDHERFQDLPIIVVSTRDRPTDHRAGLDAGADAYLSKQGLEAAELVALVRRAGGGGA